MRQPLDEKIRHAIRTGKTTCTAIASACDERMETVYNELRRMICEGEIQKTRAGALTHYHLAPKGNPLNTPETREKILDAIRAGFKSLPGIKRHAGFERSDDLTKALEDLQHDSVIKKFTNPELSAYFECPEKPRYFWQEDDGTVGAEMEEILDEPDEDPEEEEITEVEESMSPKPVFAAPVVKQTAGRRRSIEIDAAKVQELAEKGLTHREIARELDIPYGSFSTAYYRDSELQKLFKTGRQKFLENNPDKKFNPNSKVDWTPEMVEDLAARFGIYAKAAKEAGVTYQALTAQLKDHPEMRAAWKRGAARFTKPEKTKKEKTKKMKTAAKTETEKAPETTVEHQLAFDDHAAGDYAGAAVEPDPLEIPPPPAEPSNQVEEPLFIPGDEPIVGFVGNDDPFDDAEPVVDPRFEHTIDHLWEKSEASRKGFKTARQELAQTARVAGSANHRADTVIEGAMQNAAALPLAKGGRIFVGFDGNFFTMTEKERELANRIADLLNEHAREVAKN